jgi:hypothetical protein
MYDTNTLSGAGTFGPVIVRNFPFELPTCATTIDEVASLPLPETCQNRVVLLTTDGLYYICATWNSTLSQCTAWTVTTTGQDNTIENTNVSGSIEVQSDVERTVINNVNFTGSARAVITIDSNSDVTIDDLCVPNGSTINGTGTLIYKGTTYTTDWSPFAMPTGTQDCSITANDRPDPPGVN